jgi:predicted metal-binding protein
MNDRPVLFVCTVCGKNPDAEITQRAGEKLIKQVQHLHQALDLGERFLIRPVKCMGVCGRPCAIAFVAAGKFTYLFGDLPSDGSELSAATVLDCMGQYCDHPEGLLPYRERPELLRDRIIAKIPALPQGALPSS